MSTVTPLKRSNKENRERRVLLALVDHYIQSGKPVGSATLKDVGIDDLSAATIRNYFTRLDEEGYLIQQHSSGGRIPTDKAFRLYAHEQLASMASTPELHPNLEALSGNESRAIAAYLQAAAEELSLLTQSAVFLSAPRFDHDFITMIKLVAIDPTRCLCIIVTDFGTIKTEIVHIDKKLTAFAVKRYEEYFHWRLTGYNPPKNFEPDEETFAQKIYNELLVRYIVAYTNFIEDEIYRTGFSKLIAYPEFHDASRLAASLSLFENSHSMRLLLRDCSTHNSLKFWIGDDLIPYSQQSPDCAILAIPYRINNQAVGAIGLLSSARIPYGKLFGLLHTFSDTISKAITRTIYKFKIQYRHPHQQPFTLGKEEVHLLKQAEPLLLEDMRL